MEIGWIKRGKEYMDEKKNGWIKVREEWMEKWDG